MEVSKIDVLLDLQGNAHALLYRNFPTLYSDLLARWYSPTRRDQLATTFYVDDRVDSKLFFALLAFAQPEIFKTIYKNHEQCKTLLVYGLSYMYASPLEVQDANRLLDDRIYEEN